MSRIGKEPITLPKDIKVKLEGNTCWVESSKNKMQLSIPAGISLEIAEDSVLVKRENDTKQLKSLHACP